MFRSSQQVRQVSVVITGASAGVGRAVVLRFARAGARLGLIARDEDALRQVKEEAEDLGANAAMAVSADVADAQKVLAAADAIATRYGSIDIWINNAMVTVFSPVWQMTPEEFRRVTEVTYLGSVHGTMAALRHMRPRNRGTIVQVGSALAYRGIPLQAAYCGAKYAIRGFLDSLRCELIHSNCAIALTMIELPAVNTPQFDWARTHMPRQPRPVPPVVQPEAIAERIFHAALHPKREYWLGSNTVKAILGNMVVPGVLDRYLAGAAFDAQETQVPVSADRKDNLFAPVHDFHHTRGSFGDEAANTVTAVSGQLARLAPLFIAGLSGFSIGFSLYGAYRDLQRAPAPRGTASLPRLSDIYRRRRR
jgi:NAD(P)-dependent dehydrogenase (short-subunit alcohol dehydrogenase family)